MKIIRETALEILGLKENFSEEELKKAYRRLSKVTHPDSGGDENLFRLIGCCKEVLENPNIKEESRSTQSNTNNSNSTEKRKYYISLPQLYDTHYDYRWELQNIPYYLIRNNVVQIRGMVSLSIYPLFMKKHTKTMQYELNTNTNDFLNSGFVQFSKTILIPEELKKYKFFRVCIKFMERTFYCNISRKQNNNVFEYWGNDHGWGSLYKSFKTIVDLNFKF